jgi:D-glycero-D-manno-heptose 1,7-bisphosphate phosphatase
MKHPAVFLDRDGTINVEKNYLYRSEDLELLPGAAEGIALLCAAGFRVIVVSNQSGVGRGYYSEDDVRKLHQHLDQVLEHYGARIDAYYYCPHHPEQGIGSYRNACSCRKPLPGMLLQAAADLDIDLNNSFMVGDKLADVHAGKAAGCMPFLVRTGYGATEECDLPLDVPVFDTLLAAAKAIVTQRSMQDDSITDRNRSMAWLSPKE